MNTIKKNLFVCFTILLFSIKISAMQRLVHQNELQAAAMNALYDELIAIEKNKHRKLQKKCNKIEKFIERKKGPRCKYCKLR